jgi:hypothetical protein
MSFPGILTRGEFATGLIVRSIRINGYYLLVESCDIHQEQEFKSAHYLQAGPGLSITNIGAKKFKGSIKCPLRLNYAGQLDNALIELLNHAQNPISTLTIDTNHMLSHFKLTAETEITDDNRLISMDSVIVESLTISVGDGGIASLDVSFEGMVDSRTDFVPVNPTINLGRPIGWGDCHIYRQESAMRTVTKFTIKITNTIETPTFLMPGNLAFASRDDQIQLLGISTVSWTGNFDEIVRTGADLDTFIHGGYKVEDYLTLELGPIKAEVPVTMYKKATMPLVSNLLKRTTEWEAIMAPELPLSPNGLFTIS